MSTQKKRIICSLLAICVVLGISAGSAFARQQELFEEPTFPFIDVTENDWFFPAVSFMHENGIMTGASPTTFEPTAPFTRAMAVATLFRFYHGRPANANDSHIHPFSDIPANTWFSPYVAWAYASGIADGVGNGRFAPLDNVNRQQFITMVFRFADKMLVSLDTSIRQGSQWENFTDRNQISIWAQSALMWANYYGLITGRTETTLVPDDSATRAEAATLLMRFINVYRHYSGLARINISPLLHANFIDVKHLFGHVLDRVYDMQIPFYFFDTGIVVGVWDGTVATIGIGYRGFDEMRVRVYFDEIDGNSTRIDVRNVLGAPDYYEHDFITQDRELGLFYTYFLPDAALRFSFDVSDRMVGMFYTVGIGLT